MTLYEMTEQAKALYNMLSYGEIDEQTFTDTLESIGADDKINDYCIVIRQLKADAESCKEEKRRFEERIKKFESAQKRMKEALESFMLVMGKDKAKTDKFTLYHTTSKAVEITDLNAIPAEYIKPRKEDDIKNPRLRR